MVVNIRFCVSQGMLTVFRYTTVTIIEDANEALDNEKGEKKLTLHEEILFIVSYGAIRVLVMPYILFGLVRIYIHIAISCHPIYIYVYTST